MSENELHTGFVTMIGRPNVGKSTLMNRLIGQKVAITSNKPQTTRHRIRTVYTDTSRGQIVFVDTPGMHKAKNKLGEQMVKIAYDAISDVDVVLWLVEPDTVVKEGDRIIAEDLSKAKKPVFLIINKVDTVKHEEILPVIDAYKDLLEFAEVVPVSAREGEGVDKLIDLIFPYLPEGPMYYDEDTLTDQPMRAIVAEIVREKSLHSLSDEVPHGIAVEIDKMKYRHAKGGAICDIEATIICERESHKGIIIGKQGSMLKKIGSSARFEIEKMLESRVNLKLFVKVKKDWRENEYLVKTYSLPDTDFDI